MVSYEQEAQQISPWTLTSWVLSFILNSAGQPCGNVLSLQSYKSVDLRRCFPVKAALDAVTALLLWSELVFVYAKSPRDAATAILRDRLTANDDKSKLCAIKSMKNGTSLRVIGFVIGVLPAVIKLGACDGILTIQVLGYLWVGPWIVFELLIMASTSDQPRHSGDTIQLDSLRARSIQRQSSLVADMITSVLCITPPLLFSLGAWNNISVVGLAHSPLLDILILVNGSLLVLVCFSWALIMFVLIRHGHSAGFSGRLKQMFTLGGSLLLGTVWVPLVVISERSSKTADLVFIIILGGAIVFFLLFSFFRHIIWKADVYHIVNIFGGMIALFLHIFVNYSGTNTWQPSWLGFLG